MDEIDKKKNCPSPYDHEESTIVNLERLLSETKGLLEVETEKRKLLERQLKEERQSAQKEKMLRVPGSEHCLQIEVERLKREKELVEYENKILKNEIKQLSLDFENYASIVSNLKHENNYDIKQIKSPPKEIQNKDESKNNLIECPTIFDDSYNSKIKDDKHLNEKSEVAQIYNDHPNDLGSDINNKEDESEYMKTELMQQLYTDVRSQKSNPCDDDKQIHVKNPVVDKINLQPKIANNIDLFNGDDDAFGFDSFLKPIIQEIPKSTQTKVLGLPPPKVNKIQPIKQNNPVKTQQVAPKPLLTNQAGKLSKKPIINIFDDNEDEVDVFQFN